MKPPHAHPDMLLKAQRGKVILKNLQSGHFCIRTELKSNSVKESVNLSEDNSLCCIDAILSQQATEKKVLQKSLSSNWFLEWETEKVWEPTGSRYKRLCKYRQPGNLKEYFNGFIKMEQATIQLF